MLTVNNSVIIKYIINCLFTVKYFIHHPSSRGGYRYESFLQRELRLKLLSLFSYFDNPFDKVLEQVMFELFPTLVSPYFFLTCQTPQHTGLLYRVNQLLL